MRAFKSAVGSTVALALLAASVTPAMARDRHWRDYGHRHRGDGFDFGDAVGIAALIGAAVIVVKSMNKDKASRNSSGDGYNGDYADNSTHAPNGAPLPDTRSNDAPGGSGDLLAEDQAVDACAQAARDEASNGNGYAEVRSIEAPRSVADGWDIDGRVEQRRNYRDSSGETRRFTCSVRNGRIAEVYLSQDLV